jgi:hypothetical protein
VGAVIACAPLGCAAVGLLCLLLGMMIADMHRVFRGRDRDD